VTDGPLSTRRKANAKRRGGAWNGLSEIWKTRSNRIGEFLEQVYNRQRLHSALRYLTPEKFEQAEDCL
jgi:hypothetical protein